MLLDKLMSQQFKQGCTQITGCLYTVRGTHGVSTYTLVVTYVGNKFLPHRYYVQTLRTTALRHTYISLFIAVD